MSVKQVTMTATIMRLVQTPQAPLPVHATTTTLAQVQVAHSAIVTVNANPIVMHVEAQKQSVKITETAQQPALNVPRLLIVTADMNVRLIIVVTI